MTDADWRLRRLREHPESAIARHMAKLASTYPDVSAMERQYDGAFKDWTSYQELMCKAPATATPPAPAAPARNTSAAAASPLLPYPAPGLPKAA
jgi:hypothetical protein